MTDSPMVRNSRILGVFDAIIHTEQFSMNAVEIAGRGIAAEVRCASAVLGDKGEQFNDSPDAAASRMLEYSDRLIELGVVEDDLDQAFRQRLAGELDDAEFEQTLQEIVARLELWPATIGRD